MPGPALTVQIIGDTSQLVEAFSQSKSGLQTFVGGFTGLLDQTQMIKNIAGDFGELVGFVVDLGGPEANQALSDVQQSIGDELAPVMKDLAPLIVDLVKGFGDLVKTVLPPLIPIVVGLVGVLRDVFDVAGQIIGAINDLWTKFTDLIGIIKQLIDAGLNVLWDKLNDVIGIFKGLQDIVNTVMGIIHDLLGPIGDVISSVGDLLGDLGHAVGLTSDVAASAEGLGGGNRTGGSFGPQAAGTSVTIYTGADPGAVMRAVRRYQSDNGGAAGFNRRGAVAVRGW